MIRFRSYQLLATANPKAMKGMKRSYASAVLMLAPGRRSGYNVCPFASPGCLRACLNTAGHGKEEWAGSIKVHEARKRRTILFMENREEFFRILISEIEHFIETCLTHSYVGMTGKKALLEPGGPGMIPAFRLNGTSDILWERKKIPGYGKSIIDFFPDVQFYDYTKIPRRFDRPPNYHLTYSRHELPDSEEIGLDYMDQGVNMAVVFDTPKNHTLPPVYRSHYFNHPVLDGSLSDLRFLDPKGHIVGLYALEKAKTDHSGFVVHAPLRNPQRRLPFDREEMQLNALFPDME